MNTPLAIPLLPTQASTPVTLDAPATSTALATQPPRPALARGELSLARVKAHAPELARQLFEAYDFSDSVCRTGNASLDLKQAYKIVTPTQFRQLAVIRDAVKTSDTYSAVTLAGIAASLAGFAGSFFLGEVGVLTGIVSVFAFLGTSALASSLSDETRRLNAATSEEVARIASEAPLQLAQHNPTETA